MIQNKGICYICTSTFEIIPPQDLHYCIPREQPKTSDYVSSVYECEETITEIQFTGKGKITQQYLIHGNLPDIMKTFKRGEKEKITI